MAWKSLAQVDAYVITGSDWKEPDDLAAGTLLRVLPEWTLGQLSVSLAYQSRDLTPGRVRAVIDFIIEEKRRLS
jgi:DNA-binding transcriptional LysR family regulator